MDLSQVINFKRPKSTFYDILGCSPSSDIDQINKEYKVRALQLHPDKNSDPESKGKFIELQNAKDVLTDQATRKLYDAWLNSGIMVPFEQFRNRQSHTFHWASPRQTGNLSILTRENSKQVPTKDNKNDSIEIASRSSLLEKFRRYEI